MKKNRGESGFTLIELLIALSLFSLVVVGGLRLYYFSNNAFVSGTMQSEIQTEMQLALTRITNDLRLAHNLEIINKASIPTKGSPSDESKGVEQHYLFVDNGEIFLRVHGQVIPFTNINKDVGGYDLSFYRTYDDHGQALANVLGIKIQSQNPQINFELETNVRSLNLREEIQGLASSDAIFYTKNFQPEEHEEFRDRRCFIATAVYGSDANITNLLRVFRDRFLINNSLGKAFVESYYRISPGIANIIGKSKILQACIWLLLLPVVLIAYLAIHIKVTVVIMLFALCLYIFLKTKTER